jgi:serine/threonine protein kinase
MNPAEYERLRGLFSELRDLAPEARDAYLARAGADDPTLRRDLDSLLSEHDRRTSFLSTPALGSRVDLAGASPEAPLLGLPASIARYRVRHSLHESFFASVFLAEGPGGEPVAVKVLRPGLESHEIARRFDVEREALARLHHPHVARVLDSGVTEGSGPWAGRPYLVMEYVEGLPITEFCRTRRLDREERLRLFVAACEGVRHAHENGVIHRDLKPSNLLVEEREGRPVPKLIDFGIAKAAEGRLVDTELTLAGEVLGTLPYMAPEQLSGDPRGVDTRADVYALGVILYELLCGRLPLDVEGVGLLEASRIVREVAPVPLGARDASLRGDLETIAAKALAKDRELRYRTVSEFAADVERHLEGRPILARPPSTLYHLKKFAARHKRLVAAAAVVFVLLGGAVARTFLAEREASRNYADAKKTTLALLRFLLDDVLEQAPGLQDQRASTLEDLLELSDRFLAREPDDEELRKAHADVRESLGVVYHVQGKSREAEPLLLEALAKRRALAAAAPQDRSRRRDLSIALVRVGNSCEALNDSRGALEYYQEAFEIDQTLASEEPENREYADNLGWSHHRLGFLIRRLGDSVGTQGHFSQMLSIFEDLVRLHPENPDSLHGLGAAHEALAGVVGDPSETASAAGHTYVAFVVAERRAALRPNDRNAKLRLGFARQTVGNYEVGLGNLETARVLYMEAQEAFRELTEADPGDRELLVHLAPSYVDLAMMAERHGELDAALEYYDEAVRIAERLLTAPRDRLEAEGRLAAFLAERGRFLATMHPVRPGREDAERSLRITHDLATREPPDPDLMAAHAENLLFFDDEDLRDPKEALCWLERAIAIKGLTPRYESLLRRVLDAMSG